MSFTTKWNSLLEWPPIQQEQILNTLQRNLVLIHPALIVCVYFVPGTVIWTGHQKIASLPLLSPQSSRDKYEQILAMAWLANGTVGTGWREMTRYHGGQGRMSGKGRKVPREFLKRLFSRQRQGKCLRWRPSMCKSRDKKWDDVVGQLAGCKASHSPHLYPCSQWQPVSLYICHHLPQETVTAAQQSQFMSLVRSTHPLS